MGAGSLGPVFRGSDPDSGEPIAIKVIQVGLTPPQVQTVADALGVLVADWPAHPSLAAPVGAGIAEAAPYVVWPLVSGDPLDVALREYGPAAAPDAAERLVGLAEALDAAAEAGAWHGALHPRDIIVGERDTVVVGAGIVPLLERVGARPPIRRPYVAPEVLGGERTSAAADQYSLAAIAYEWLFGVRITGPADALMTVPAIPDVDRAALAEAFTSALAIAPQERFADCRAFVEALVTATGGPRPKRVPRAARARRPRPAVEPLPLMFGDADAGLEAADTLDELRRDDGPLADVEAPVASPVVELGPELAPAPELASVVVPPAAPDLRPQAPVDDTPLALHGGDARSPLDDAPIAPALATTDPLDRLAPASRLGPEPPAPPPLGRAGTLPVDTAPRGFGITAVVASLIAGLVLGLVAGYVLALRAWSLAPEPGRQARAAAPADVTAPPAGSPNAGPAPGTTPPAAASSAARDVAAPADEPIPVAPAAGAPAPSPPVAGPPAGVAPAAAAPAPTPTGRLLVRSVPAGADVSVDGERRGVTPLTLRDVALGTRRVTISRDGYTAAEQRIALTRARPSRTVDVTLRRPRPATPAPAATARDGSLAVESRPAGARVTVDGRPVGVTPLVLSGLAPGTHAVRVERDGYEPVTAQARIVAGERARVAVTLTERF